MSSPPSRGLFTILVLLFATYVFGKFQGGFVSWFIFYAYLPVAAVSLFQYFFGLSGVTVTRKVDKTRCVAGEALEVTLVIHNPYRLPLVYLVLKDHLPAKLKARTSGPELVVHPWFKRAFKVTYQIENLPRGSYQWQRLELLTGNWFGLISCSKTVEEKQTLLVYPRYQEIVSWSFGNDLHSGMVRAARVKKSEETASVIGARDYAPGDRLARIHWKASAKSAGLKTKEFEHQVSHDVMLFLDRERQAYGDAEHPLFEMAVSLAASLARYALKHRFSCGLVSYGQTPVVLPPRRESEQLYRIFEHLAHVKADATYAFGNTVLREVVHLPRGTTAVMLSPVLNKQMVMLLADLSYRKMKAAFFWIKGGREATPAEHQHLLLLHKVGIPVYTIASASFPSRLSRSEIDASFAQTPS
ncbi:protein of unknown function DUF58 [Caldalkalibacillus thermarum TA2.A1]|uniref:DUF58 domain-containing protein n=1 Tax=Caldalkalibacillus thermarum (strain TA2.A1) TaxID=986075 RepID=F5L6Q2_CALTT|nr:DUF58 domain-containing protein [Caldalkalibacillus thermarum]EGL83003.1 protein of unknown function DUF58 [Caldalkalibacillus thermarum TA2.A1]